MNIKFGMFKNEEATDVNEREGEKEKPDGWRPCEKQRLQHNGPLGRKRNIVVGGRIGTQRCLFLAPFIPVPCYLTVVPNQSHYSPKGSYLSWNKLWTAPQKIDPTMKSHGIWTVCAKKEWREGGRKGGGERDIGGKKLKKLSSCSQEKATVRKAGA